MIIPVKFTQQAANRDGFWKQGTFALFKGVKNVDIQYAFFTHKKQSPALIIVPGRSEAYLKYQELAFDLFNQGYSIFIIDHRGQGLSERLLTNTNKGFVEDFQYYVDDLRYFVENIVLKNCSKKPFILAHSMGGAIATRFMQDSPDAIKAAVISSPMLGFNSGFIPQIIPKALITMKLAINKLVSKTPWYFWGQGNYRLTVFSKNNLSHCAQRYKHFTDLYEENKMIQLGGVTSQWLAQSITAQKEIFAKIPKITTPTLLLQAGSDCIVSQQAQNDFCQLLHAQQPQSCPSGMPVRIDGAYHELFFEVDEYRNVALQETLAWLQQHT
ncbi:MAG: alpha/beta fold hydrolase [Colwellia sp.]|nr:alpha/beta fold hydrolase [Colwellia sp.]